MNLIYRILSITPFISVTTDSGFGGTFKKNHSFDDIRFSLIKIPLGASKVHILTYTTKGFKFIHRLMLKDLKYGKTIKDNIRVLCILEENRLEAIEENNPNHLEVFQKDKDFLLYLIENEKERRATAHTKVDIYFASYFVVIPIIFSLLSIKTDVQSIDNTRKILIFGYCLLFYYILNIGLFLFETIKVGGIEKFKFSDFKNDERTFRENLAYYFDWQNEKYYSDLIVSFILNIQNNIIYLFLTTIFMFVIGKFM